MAFIEVAELEVIDGQKTDHAIEIVKQQVRDFHERGYELGLHLHPQWFNAQYQNGTWLLDYSEYNICNQPRHRIIELVTRSVEYLRKLLGKADYSPLSFRAGNWLYQPSQTITEVLVENGIKVDSSVFKGGLQRQLKLDYRRALKNGYVWTFAKDVEIPDAKGSLIELPIHTKMVPLWKLLTPKRVGLQRKAPSTSQALGDRLFRLLDFLRVWHPIKFDFCRLTTNELTGMLDEEIEKDLKDPDTFRPLVAIGHTKDLVDFETVERLLSYLTRKNIPVMTFRDVCDRLFANMKCRNS